MTFHTHGMRTSAHFPVGFYFSAFYPPLIVTVALCKPEHVAPHEGSAPTPQRLPSVFGRFQGVHALNLLWRRFKLFLPIWGSPRKLTKEVLT